MPDACLLPFQAKLYELFDSRDLRRPIGMYDAVTSAQNTGANAAQMKLVGEPRRQRGKKAKYQITWVDASCGEVLDVGDDGTGICDAGTKEDVQSAYKTITNHIALPNIEISIEDMKDICNYSIPEYIMSQLLGRLDMGMREVNTRLNAVACASAGCFATGDADPKDISLINPNTNTPYFGALHQVDRVFRDAGMPVTPIYVGGSTLDFYKYAQSRSGIDGNGNLRNAETMPPIFYDNQLSTDCPITDRETMIAFAPGTLQFVNYLENVGDFRSNITRDMDLIAMYQTSEMYNFGTWTDPRTGYIWDVSVQYIQCDQKYIIRLTSQFDLWAMPLTQCYADCFTGVLKYGVCTYTPPACSVAS